MLDQITKANELCEPKEKPHHLNKNQIISYLSFLEKLYEKENKNSDKFSQKRKFLINKALNSVRKYSNFKVSPFSLNKSSLKEEQKEKDKCDIVEEEKKDIFVGLYDAVKYLALTVVTVFLILIWGGIFWW